MDLTQERDLLVKHTNNLALALTDEQIDSLITYLQLLVKWNKAYNLTAIREPEKMISLHLLDSLASLPYITGQRVIDVGTGPGLPGMVLALCLPSIITVP